MDQTVTIALSGNPNSGKTTLFNAITGARQHIANYPGVTVEKKTGMINHKGGRINVVDLPGTYSLTAYSIEEIVARNFLVNERPDLVVDIVDASNLERNLYLTVQFKELGVPLILALNMVDVAQSRGIIIDFEGLSQLLGIPVVPMVARSKKGIIELLDNIIKFESKTGEFDPKFISYGIDIDQSISEIEALIEKSDLFDKKYPSKWLALKCIEGDSEVVKYLEGDQDTGKAIDEISRRTARHIKNTLEDEPEGIIADHRYGYISGITKKVVKREIETRLNLSDKADRILTNRIIGPAVMLAILYGIYEFTFWASEVPVSWLEDFFGWLKRGLFIILPEGYLQSLIVSGIIDGVGGILSFVPLIMFIFIAIAVMEDSGYMARVAYMLDRILRWFGLHGNSVMALIVSGGISGGCAVPGVMAARTLRDPKERIATLLVVPFMNCGAKLPVFAMLISAFFIKYEVKMMFFITLLSWMFALFAAKFIRATVLRGPKTPFVMELPPYRAPTIKGILIHTGERTWQYIRKAGTVILGMSILLWAMMTFPGLSKERIESFELEKEKLCSSFLSDSRVADRIKNERELDGFDDLVEQYQAAAEDYVKEVNMDDDSLFSATRSVVRIKGTGSWTGEESDKDMELAFAYVEYKRKLALLSSREKQEHLESTVAGKLGKWLEFVSRGIGFDYRTNIAVAGGFVAKEVILSTLGTAYSLSEGELEDSGSLAERLGKDPSWNPLRAFILIIFIMLYVPCFVTVISIGRESSWVWAGFSVVFNLIVAYIICFILYQAGLMLRIGL